MIKCQNLDKGEGGGGRVWQKGKCRPSPFSANVSISQTPPHCVLPINTLSLTVVTIMLDAFQGFL